MFGGKEKMADNKGVTSNQTTLIASGTSIKGDVSFQGNLELEGQVEGSITADGEQATVRIINNGRLQGEVRAPRAIIDGHVIGNVYATEYVELAGNARVEGDVYYQELEMIKGARINGQLIFSAKEKPVTNSKATTNAKQPLLNDKTSSA